MGGEVSARAVADGCLTAGGASRGRGLVVGVEVATIDSGQRERSVLAVLESHGPSLRRSAIRISLCEADADDALQRSVEIALHKAPALAGRHLAAWLYVVTRREALAVRRQRERLLGPVRRHRERAEADEDPDPLERIPSPLPDPFDRLLRDESVAEGAALLARLKPHERIAIALQAEGYSYAEIGSMCGWTYTKVNRCLAEGRAELRRLRALR